MDAFEAIERNRLAVPAPLAAGQQADGRDVRCQIEPFGRQRSLEVLQPIERQHTLAGVAVELDVDPRKSNGSADHVGLRLKREAAEPAARRGLLTGPAQRVTQGRGIGRKRTLHFERGAIADVAIECELERCAREPFKFAFDGYISYHPTLKM